MQSVKHAHVHFVSSEAPEYSLGSLVAVVPSDILHCVIHGLDDLRKVFQEDREYVYIEEDGNEHVFLTRGYNGSPIRLRDLFVARSGLEGLRNWQTMPAELRECNEAWVRKTVETLKE